MGSGRAYVTLESLCDLDPHGVDRRAIASDGELRCGLHTGGIELDELDVATRHLQKGSDFIKDALNAGLRQLRPLCLHLLHRNYFRDLLAQASL